MNAGTITVRVNGTQAVSKGGISTNFKIDRIGLKFDGTTAVATWAGDMMEIIAVPSTSNREEIEGFLAHKWGIQGDLNAGHTYASSAPSSWSPSDVSPPFGLMQVMIPVLYK